MRILLLSAYDAMSHRYWRQGMVAQFPEHHWTVKTLPPRHFSWRIHGNAMSWFFSEKACLERPYDLIVATSMVDVATLKGLIPSLAATRTIVYFHENQFAYPSSASKHDDIEIKIRSIYSAFAADAVVFNSEYNRTTFLQGADQLLNKMPDALPKNISETIEKKSHLLPVPLLETCFSSKKTAKESTFNIIWNHRWEYDKAPERLYKALLQLQERGLSFRLHLLGQRFNSAPAVFETIHQSFHQHIDTWGFIENRDAYVDLLRRSQVVISTALHDFQGLAVMEAVAAGCLPLVPDRLAYQEYIPDSYRFASYPEDEDSETSALADHIMVLAKLHGEEALAEPLDISNFGWKKLRNKYQFLLQE